MCMSQVAGGVVSGPTRRLEGGYTVRSMAHAVLIGSRGGKRLVADGGAGVCGSGHDSGAV